MRSSTADHVATEPTIADEVRELRQRVAQLEARLSPGPRDQADVTLASTIAASACGLPFTAAALWRRRAVDPALTEALVASDVDSPRQLGKLLRRLEGRDIEGVCFARVGINREGLVWIATLRE